MVPPRGTIGTVFDIIKLTPTYHATEDRLRLNLQTQQGPVLAMWLTQRLATLIVVGLARQLDDEVKVEAAGRSRAPLHAFEQSTAVALHKPQQAVAAAQARDSGLVDKLDVARRGGRYTLTWSSHGGAQARMSVDPLQLRQLLEIFRRVFTKAGWNTAQWPAWLREPAAAPAAETSKPSAYH